MHTEPASTTCGPRWRARTATLGLSIALLAVATGGADAAQTPQAASSSAALVTVAVSPYRVLDTRLGIGTAGSAAPVGPGADITVQIAGVGPVPTNAVGVVLNLTAVSGTAPSYITAWPTSTDRPTASVLNVTPGIDLPNMITALLGDGQISLYNNTGSVHLIADIAGYLIPDTGGGTPPPTGPTQHTLELTGYSMVLLSTASTYSASYGCAYLGGAGLLDLPLPAGAQITAVRVAYNDASTTRQLSVELYRGTSPNSEEQASQMFNTGNPATGAGTATLALTDVPTVSDANRYYLYAFTAAGSGSVSLCGAAVDYTLVT